MAQLDFICNECPLEVCDEESLWCVFRFITQPNAAQKAIARQIGTRPPVSQQTLKRREYHSNRYREQKRAAGLSDEDAKRDLRFRCTT